MSGSCWGTSVVETGQEFLREWAESRLASTIMFPCPEAFQSVLELTSIDAAGRLTQAMLHRRRSSKSLTVRPELEASHELLKLLLRPNLEQAVITKNI